MTPQQLTEITVKVIKSLKQDYLEDKLFCPSSAELAAYRLRDQLHQFLLENQEQQR